MFDPKGDRRRAKGPYRDTNPNAPRARSDGLRPGDMLVVAAVVLSVAALGYWRDAVDVFATRVLGFPPLP